MMLEAEALSSFLPILPSFPYLPSLLGEDGERAKVDGP